MTNISVTVSTPDQILKKSKDTLRVAKLSRVSSDEQTSGGGIDAQERINQRSMANIDKEVITVLEIIEEGISGTQFPRKSLLKILDFARKGHIEAVVVKDVSRIGRLAGPTFAFIWMLNTQFNVEIISEDGRFNVHSKTDLIQMFFDSLNAEMKNRFRTSYVVESQLESFRQGNFHVTGRKVRFGYKKTSRDNEDEATEDGDDEINQEERLKENQDLKINPDESEVLKRLFDIVVEVGAVRNLFANVREKLDHEFDKDRLPDENENLKRLLRNPIYKGEPTWEVDLAAKETKTATMDRPDLAIVEKETFDEVAEILDTRATRHFTNYGSESDSTTDHVSLQQLTSTVGLSRLVAFNHVVRIHCPDCGEEMQDNGHWRATSDIRPSNMTDLPKEPILKRYKCPNEECERNEKRFPNEYEGYMLLNMDIPIDTIVEQV